MTFLSVILLVLCLVVCFVIFCVSIYFIIITFSSGFMKHSPTIPTTGKTLSVMLQKTSEYIDTHSLNHSLNIIDAGCGWGTLLIPLARKYPSHHFIGIEYSFLPYILAKWRVRNLPNATIIRQNLFTYPFHEADVILYFLLPSEMKRFSLKLKNEVKKTCFICSNRFPLYQISYDEKIDLNDNFSCVYIYKTDGYNKF